MKTKGHNIARRCSCRGHGRLSLWGTSGNHTHVAGGCLQRVRVDFSCGGQGWESSQEHAFQMPGGKACGNLKPECCQRLVSSCQVGKETETQSDKVAKECFREPGWHVFGKPRSKLLPKYVLASQPGWESLGTPESRTLPVDAFEMQGLGRFGEPKVMILPRYRFDVLGWGNLETIIVLTLLTCAFGTQDWGHLGMPWAAILLECAFSTLVWGGLGNPNPQYCQNMPLKCQVWEILGT